jgi:hypothetical protein
MSNQEDVSKCYLDGLDLDRAKMLVNEIDDFMNSIRNEVNQDRAYKGYLAEKLNGLENDLRCLRGMIECE